MSATLLSLLLVTATPFQEQDPPVEPAPQEEIEEIAPSSGEVELTFLANEGFLIHSGNVSILIDAFVRTPHEGYGALPGPVMDKLARGEAPFDGFVFGLISHKHRDHVQPRLLERFLKSNERAAVMTSADVIRAVVPHVKDFEMIKRQLRTVAFTDGTPQVLQQRGLGMRVEFIPIPHGGSANEDVTNLAHLIKLGGVTILHLGDADANKKIFRKLDLASRDIDIAFVPYWFFLDAESATIVDQLIDPRMTVACHVPPKELQLFSERMKLENPDVVVFTSSMQKLTLDGSSKSEPASPPKSPKPPKKGKKGADQAGGN
jgi:L-ascorbate metabolism protein UlaG (beta-lactamase superfamily)